MQIDQKTVEMITELVSQAIAGGAAPAPAGNDAEIAKLLPQYTPFDQTCPTILGAGAIRLLGYKAKELGVTKALIATDEGIVKAGIVEKAKAILTAAGVDFVVYDKVNPNPLDTVCEEGGALAAGEKVNGIIALGGGSVIDAAKTMNIMINNPPPVSAYYRSWDYKPGVPLIIVPTTAGTGSENTIFAVISDHKTHAKNVTMAKGDLALCDPDLTRTVPRDLIASTGMDVFAHAAESYTANITCLKTDLFALEAIRRVVKWLPVVYQDPANAQARYEMMAASNLAGASFSDTLCHLGHATSHSLGVRLGVAHGISCAWALPETLAYVADAVPERVRNIAAAMGIPLSPYATDREVGKLVADAIRVFMRRLDIASIRGLGFSKEETVNCSDLIVLDVCFPIIPKPTTEQDVKEFLGRVYDTYQ
ncbi:MAG: iron-containing alcohol dehydrogenase [Gracilibacteraceae bacterium]|nr:iron-containing alcohol dehydrogenase [Gracilibacteraceae bacterium]